MFGIKLRSHVRSHKGFSLVETGAVLLVTGVTMLAGAQFVHIYSKNTKHLKTIEHLEIGFSGIQEYAGLSGAYPCPADPTLPPGDPLYGVGQCRDESSSSFDKNSCTGVPAGIHCTTVGSRDADGNGHNDVVIMGALPIQDLINSTSETPIKSYHRTDGYGGLIAYAVTESLTETYAGNNLATQFDPLMGAINVLDENKISVMNPKAEGQFAIYSFGRDGVGAHSPKGKLIDSCFVPSSVGAPPDISPPPGLHSGTTGGKLQTENCDNNDAYFIKGILSLGNNSKYYDDYFYYEGKGMSSLWKRALISAPGESYIYNTNLGNVGVDTSKPTKKLHVMGNIGAQSDVRSAKFCNPMQTACLNPKFLGGYLGSQAKCGTGKIAYAVGKNKVYCRKVDWSVPSDKTCSPIDGYPSYLTGFSNQGNIFCCTRSGSCDTY